MSEKIFDYKKHIEMMRQKFRCKSPHSDDRLLVPQWLQYGKGLENSPIHGIYANQKRIFEKGNIYWATLVQANELLFKRAPLICIENDDRGACIIYSTDPYFDDKPYGLKRIASKLYSDKGIPFTQNMPEELKEINEAITNEVDWLFNIKIPHSITEGKDVYYTSAMMVRKHLPKKRLISSIFPILANPKQFLECIVVPKFYWSSGLCRNYCGK